MALHTAPIEIKNHLYKQLLLPSIEYCSAIWDPYHNTSIYKLEEHRAARFVLNKPCTWMRSSEQQHDSITDMLKYLDWPTLQDRKTVSWVTLLFKILRKLIVVPDRCLPPLVPVPYTRSYHPLKLFHLQTRIDVYKYSFLLRQFLNGTNYLSLILTGLILICNLITEKYSYKNWYIRNNFIIKTLQFL